MTKSWLYLGAAPALTLAASVARAQTPPAPAPAPLMRHAFEDSDGGWTGMGTNAKVFITHDAAKVKEGSGALQFDY